MRQDSAQSPLRRARRAARRQAQALVVQVQDVREARVRRRLDHTALVLGSALFDEEWYSMLLGRALDRPQAVAHFLSAAPAGDAATPHPLVAPGWMVSQGAAPAAEGGRSVEVAAYLELLRKPSAAVRTHPLFDVDAYVAQHPGGPVAHYVDVGAREGAPPNDWYRPRPRRQPSGLVGWIWNRTEAWARTRALLAEDPVPTSDVGTPAATPVVSVLLVADGDAASVSRSARSVLAQSDAAWELLLLVVDGGLAPHELELPYDERIRVVEGSMPHAVAAYNLGLAVGTGAWATMLLPGDTWLPTRLADLRSQLGEETRWASDAVGVGDHVVGPVTRAAVLAGRVSDGRGVVLDRVAAVAVGGLDEQQQETWVAELLLSLSGEGHTSPRVGVRSERETPREWTAAPWQLDVVRRRHLAWNPSARTRSGSLTVVAIARSAEQAARCLTPLLAHTPPAVQVLVADATDDAVDAAVVASLLARADRRSTLVPAPGAGTAHAYDVAVAQALGETVVLVSPDAVVGPGWSPAVIEPLGDDSVVLARARQGGLVACRRSDMHEQRGLDPVFVGRLDAAMTLDLERRLTHGRARFAVVVPGVPVTVEPEAPEAEECDQRVLAERWSERPAR